LASFPKDFLWGAATSAYQIEGSPLADGAGPNIWHRFTHARGLPNGDVACDHYRRWREDLELLSRLGVGAYRFSVAWARVMPEGRGRVNRPGLAFYERLVDELLERGIAPLITLYHWDLPADLDDLGGWVNRDVASWFADYAEVMFRALGDRVPMWATINEPWVITDAGYLHGTHAPGHQSVRETPIASHNLLRAHGAAVERYRGLAKQRIGIVINLEPKDPASESEADLAATERSDAYMNRQFLDPLYFGRYPVELAEMYGEAWPRFDEADFKLITQPTDYLGLNYYRRGVMRDDPSALIERASHVKVPGATYTTLGWEVHAPSFRRMLRWVRDRYGAIPLYVTENGAAFPDVAPFNDTLRIQYYRDHLAEASGAIADGVDLRGYFAWSLLDNYEWGSYDPRFGLAHVDFATQKRTPKASFEFYRGVIG